MLYILVLRKHLVIGQFNFSCFSFVAINRKTSYDSDNPRQNNGIVYGSESVGDHRNFCNLFYSPRGAEDVCEMEMSSYDNSETIRYFMFVLTLYSIISNHFIQ